MTNKRVHLVCNAHLDPVWLWLWQDGLAETLSTFRTAVEFCENNEDFIFNHNESLLYQWVEEYDPELFDRIQKMVQAGRWNIMGGWFVQPDCNMPAGESFVRHIVKGKNYFKEKFGVDVTTAINFDPFGHSRGLVQLLAKSGYDSYLFGRPWQSFFPLEEPDFIWIGFDGSEIMAHRFAALPEQMYNNHKGKAAEKIENRLVKYGDSHPSLIPWGIGNHGGGPSKIDLAAINQLISEHNDIELIHSTPQAYFKELSNKRSALQKVDRDLNPWAVGCYSSMIRIKQLNRRLENEIYMLEKMATSAGIQGLIDYPENEINDALWDLLFAQFHDILPGSATQIAESASIRMLSHGIEIAERAKAKAFFALCSGQPKANEGQIPILVYNPHPFDIEDAVECEFILEDNASSDRFTEVAVYCDDRKLFTQVEQESSNCNTIEWHKKVVFHANLKAGQMNRFDCRLKVLDAKPAIQFSPANNVFDFRTDRVAIKVNQQTGLIDRYSIDGVDYLAADAFKPIIIEDTEDSWEQIAVSFKKVIGSFELVSPQQAADVSGLRAEELAPVRVIEDGPVRTVVEAIFNYRNSYLIQRYSLPKIGTELGVSIRVYWFEKNKMLKLSVPTVLQESKYYGQVAYGCQYLPDNGNEAVAQKWVSVIAQTQQRALVAINDGTYSSSFENGQLYLTLLRSPAYSCGPADSAEMVTQNRFAPRIDQGERMFNFWFDGCRADQIAAYDRKALAKNEKPMALSYFPSGKGQLPLAFALLNDDVIQLQSAKKAEKSDDIILRCYNPSEHEASTIIEIPLFNIQENLTFGPFEVKTLKVTQAGALTETDLLENEIRD